MSGRLLLFGGTAEGREILTYGLPAICCVATEYGAKMLEGTKNAEIRTGRISAAQIAELINERGISCVIDATHPYAAEVTDNIRRACDETGTPRRRVSRAKSFYGGASVVSSCAEAADELDKCSGNVLLTTGSKELSPFKKVKGFRERLFVRVLPTEESISLALAAGFAKERIIAAQGPFTIAENEAALRRAGAGIIVTKDGGAPGGMEEKLLAAEKLGVKVIVIARPPDNGCTVKQAVFWARRTLGLPRPPFFPMYTDIEKEKIVVVGGGPVALRRAGTLNRCGAKVTVIAPEMMPEFKNAAFELIKRPYRGGDLAGAALAVAATGCREVNRLVENEAEERSIPVNSADLAEAGGFYFPSLIEENGVTVSVSSSGADPKLTKFVSDKLRKILPLIIEEAKKNCRKTGEGANVECVER